MKLSATELFGFSKFCKPNLEYDKRFGYATPDCVAINGTDLNSNT